MYCTCKFHSSDCSSVICKRLAVLVACTHIEHMDESIPTSTGQQHGTWGVGGVRQTVVLLTLERECAHSAQTVVSKTVT